MLLLLELAQSVSPSSTTLVRVHSIDAMNVELGDLQVLKNFNYGGTYAIELSSM